MAELGQNLVQRGMSPDFGKKRKTTAQMVVRGMDKVVASGTFGVEAGIYKILFFCAAVLTLWSMLQ